MTNFLIFSASTILLFLLIDFLQKRVIKSYSWSRKATHIAAGGVILLMPSYLTVTEIVLMSVSFIGILMISKYMNILSLHIVKRKSWGEVIYPSSVGALALICIPAHKEAYYVGILCLALADATANFVGTSFPIKAINIGKDQKSWGGCFAFFTVTFIIFSAFFLPQGASIFLIIAVSMVLTLSELVAIYGTDNFVVPVLAALLSIWLF
jgi:dolichol kinase